MLWARSCICSVLLWEIDEYGGREWETASGPFFTVYSKEVLEENNNNEKAYKGSLKVGGGRTYSLPEDLESSEQCYS